MTNPANISPPGPTKPAKKPLWRRLLKWTFRAAIVLIVLAIAVWAITDYWAANKIHTEIAKIRAAGDPLTFTDLDAMYPKVDADKNAGPYYAAAVALVRSIDYDSPEAEPYFKAFRKQDVAPSPDLLAKAHADLEKNRLALELLDRACASPESYYDLQIQFGILAAFNQTLALRELDSVSSLRTRLCAYEQRTDDAISSLHSSLRLTRVFERQPLIFTSLVQWTVVVLACKDVSVILERSHPDAAALHSLDAALAGTPIISPHEMLLAERVYFLELTMAGSADRKTNPMTGPLPESNQFSTLGLMGRVWTANGLDIFNNIIASAGNDWPTALAAMGGDNASRVTWWNGTFVSQQTLQMPLAIGASTASMLNATRVAIQIERYRLTHTGSLPDSLDKLPEFSSLPNDPLTNKPLLYTKTPDGYCVYGAGHNPPADRDKDPIKWSEKWGIHIRIPAP